LTSGAPVDFGAAAARFTGAPLIIASVISGPAEKAEEDLAASAAPALDELRGEVQSEAVELECRELTGPSAARALHEAAEATDAGLLVVGSTGRGAVGRVFPGSTADRLMHGAPCPIAVVPHEWNVGAGPRTTGVAYVDTEEGRDALRGAHSLARRADATLRVLTVVRTGLGMFGETEATIAGQRGKDLEDVEGGYRVFAEQRARADVSGLDGDARVEVDALVDDPADTLIRISENLDLLVCGSRGYGPLRAVLLGGVSRRVAAEAHCPVIMLRAAWRVPWSPCTPPPRARRQEAGRGPMRGRPSCWCRAARLTYRARL
jgi:nucleotide-binding universal stress UspA family protein